MSKEQELRKGNWIGVISTNSNSGKYYGIVEEIESGSLEIRLKGRDKRIKILSNKDENYQIKFIPFTKEIVVNNQNSFLPLLDGRYTNDDILLSDSIEVKIPPCDYVVKLIFEKGKWSMEIVTSEGCNQLILFEYVHELQNLYYEHTKLELELTHIDKTTI